MDVWTRTAPEGSGKAEKTNAGAFFSVSGKKAEGGGRAAEKEKTDHTAGRAPPSMLAKALWQWMDSKLSTSTRNQVT